MNDRPLAQNRTGVLFILLTCGAFWLMLLAVALAVMVHPVAQAKHARRPRDDAETPSNTLTTAPAAVR